jgi:hypothetical protein
MIILKYGSSRPQTLFIHRNFINLEDLLFILAPPQFVVEIFEMQQKFGKGGSLQAKRGNNAHLG